MFSHIHYDLITIIFRLIVYDLWNMHNMKSHQTQTVTFEVRRKKKTFLVHDRKETFLGHDREHDRQAHPTLKTTR